MNEKEIMDMYFDGKSTYEIAKEFKTYPNKIRRILIKNGIELKTKSDAQKNAIQRGTTTVPTKGKKRTKDEKINISRGLKNWWKTASEEVKNSISQKAKQQWREMSEKQRQAMTELAISAIRVAGREGSKLEKFLFSELTKNKYVVEFHKKNLIANKNLEIDMYVPSLKTIIEIDGPSHFLPIWGEEKLQKQIKADSAKTGLILSKGFVIIRIKNMKDRISIASKEFLKTSVLRILCDIENNFPDKSNRYIEVEIT